MDITEIMNQQNAQVPGRAGRQGKECALKNTVEEKTGDVSTVSIPLGHVPLRVNDIRDTDRCYHISEWIFSENVCACHMGALKQTDKMMGLPPPRPSTLSHKTSMSPYFV